MNRYLLPIFMLIVLPVVATAQESFRTWQSSSGTYSVEAKLLYVENGKVALEKRDGKVVKVPVSQLSSSDQSYLEKSKGLTNPAVAKIQPGKLSGQADTTGKIRDIKTELYGSDPIVISPSNRMVVVGGDGILNFFDIESSKKTLTTKKDHRLGTISYLRADPTGKYILAAGSLRIRVFSFRDGGLHFGPKFVGHQSFIQGMELSSNGRFCISWGIDEDVYVWEVSTGRQVRKFKLERYNANHCWVSDDGRNALCGCDSNAGEIYELDCETGQVSKVQISDRRVTGRTFQFSKDGQSYAYSDTGGVYAVDIATKETNKTKVLVPKGILIAPDNSFRVIHGSTSLLIQDTASGEFVSSINSSVTYTKCLAISIDSQYIIVWERGSIAVYEVSKLPPR